MKKYIKFYVQLDLHIKNNIEWLILTVWTLKIKILIYKTIMIHILYNVIVKLLFLYNNISVVNT
jgi:hypothetical protein